MIYQSLKTILEQNLAAFLLDFAGVGGAHLNVDIPFPELIKVVKRGALLYPEDYSRGPLAKIKISSYQTTQVEIGGGEGELNMVASGVVEIAGVTHLVNTSDEAGDASGRMEEIAKGYLGKPKAIQGTITTSTGNMLLSYAANLSPEMTQYGIERVTQGKGKPQIGAGVASVGNTSNGTVDITQVPIFAGFDPVTYTLQIVTPNLSPGVLAGMTYRWKADSGSFTSSITPTGGPLLLSHNVYAAFLLGVGQNFVAGDAYSVVVSPSFEQWAGIWYNSWTLQLFLHSE